MTAMEDINFISNAMIHILKSLFDSINLIDKVTLFLHILIIFSYRARSFAKIRTIDGYDSVCIMVQITDKFF